MTTGWCYCLPVLNLNMRNKELDLCLPHLSILFGFMEDETDVVFIKMGLLSFTNNNERQKMTMVVKKVWEDLKGKFKIQNLIEVSPLRLNGIATNVFFIKLGHCLLNPPKIWKKITISV